jgi:hypothetical protein
VHVPPDRASRISLGTAVGRRKAATGGTGGRLNLTRSRAAQRGFRPIVDVARSVPVAVAVVDVIGVDGDRPHQIAALCRGVVLGPSLAALRLIVRRGRLDAGFRLLGAVGGRLAVERRALGRWAPRSCGLVVGPGAPVDVVRVDDDLALHGAGLGGRGPLGPGDARGVLAIAQLQVSPVFEQLGVEDARALQAADGVHALVTAS